MQRSRDNDDLGLVAGTMVNLEMIQQDFDGAYAVRDRLPEWIEEHFDVRASAEG